MLHHSQDIIVQQLFSDSPLQRSLVGQTWETLHCNDKHCREEEGTGEWRGGEGRSHNRNNLGSISDVLSLKVFRGLIFFFYSSLLPQKLINFKLRRAQATFWSQSQKTDAVLCHSLPIIAVNISAGRRCWADLIEALKTIMTWTMKEEWNALILQMLEKHRRRSRTLP